MKPKVQYKGLSKDEVYLISRAEYDKQRSIGGEYARKVFGGARKAANVLDRLKRKGRLTQIERGKYFIVPIRSPNQLWAPNEFIAAKYWMGEAPYYIGYFSMYNYWGLTEQVPQTVFILNTKKSRSKKIGDVKFRAVKIEKNKYYGITKIRIEDEDICISDKERTLVDFIYKPVGTFNNIKKVLKEDLGEIDRNKLIDYLIRFPVVAVRKRAGYLLEQLHLPARYLNKLKKNIGNRTTFVVLDPSGQRAGKINKEWGIIVNR